RGGGELALRCARASREESGERRSSADGLGTRGARPYPRRLLGRARAARPTTVPDPAAKIEKAPIPAADLASPILKGPQKSERLGAVLGIDLGYSETALSVSRENRMPRASVVITTAARTIIRLSKGGEKIESIAAIGSEIDPTAHPDFREITGNL